MKRNFFTAKLILFLCLMAQTTFSQNSELFSLDNSPLPNPTSPVMDYAGVLDPSTQKRIEKLVIDFKERTNPSVELGVAVVKTTGDRPIFDYSLAVARGWGIGSREDDNPGALLFIAVDDRKYYTQVSRNLEDELPDGLVGSLQRQYLVPQFKKGDYGKGIEDTIQAYIRTIEQKQSGEPVTNDKDNGFRGYDDVADYGKSNCDGIFICLIIVGILIFIIISNSGGGGGGGGGGRRRRNSGSGVAGDILSGILAGVVSGAINGGGSSSSGSSWGGSSGGSSGGGWGGFGGGGDFGGGGAGGGW